MRVVEIQPFTLLSIPMALNCPSEVERSVFPGIIGSKIEVFSEVYSFAVIQRNYTITFELCSS